MAYYLKLAPGYEPQGPCAYYQPWDNEGKNLFFDSCFTKAKAQVLCEMPPLKEQEFREETIELSMGEFTSKRYSLGGCCSS